MFSVPKGDTLSEPLYPSTKQFFFYPSPWFKKCKIIKLYGKTNNGNGQPLRASGPGLSQCLPPTPPPPPFSSLLIRLVCRGNTSTIAPPAWLLLHSSGAWSLWVIVHSSMLFWKQAKWFQVGDTCFPFRCPRQCPCRSRTCIFFACPRDAFQGGRAEVLSLYLELGSF